MRTHYIAALCLALSILSFSPCGGEQKDILAAELPEDARSPVAHVADTRLAHDKQLEAYIQGVLDSKFAKYNVTVSVRNGAVFLTHLPGDEAKANRIIAFVKKHTNVTDISKTEDVNAEEIAKQKDIAKQGYSGIWLPQSTVLFPTQVANPRQICFSIGHRMNDSCMGRNASIVTFGDQFPMYRWANIWRWKGDLQLEIEAGVFAVFNQDRDTKPLRNADYYVGVPLSYAVDKWAFRLRPYHISSHLGDEYMQEHPHRRRKNKSFEALDVFTSYQMTNGLRLYGGVGAVVHSDSEMHVKPLYAEYGFEVRAFRHDFTQLFGQPFLATHFCNAQEHDYRFDATYALGYEWGKIHGVGRKIRLFLEYHDGYSYEGQFSRHKTDYLALRLAYGF